MTKINVNTQWYQAVDEAVFQTVDGVTSIFYWRCQHNVRNYECIRCGGLYD